MIGNECLGPLSEMSQDCERNLTTLEVFESVLEVVVIEDGLKKLKCLDQHADIDGSLWKGRSACMRDAAPAERRVVSVERHDDASTQASVLKNHWIRGIQQPCQLSRDYVDTAQRQLLRDGMRNVFIELKAEGHRSPRCLSKS